MNVFLVSYIKNTYKDISSNHEYSTLDGKQGLSAEGVNMLTPLMHSGQRANYV